MAKRSLSQITNACIFIRTDRDNIQVKREREGERNDWQGNMSSFGPPYQSAGISYKFVENILCAAGDICVVCLWKQPTTTTTTTSDKRQQQQQQTPPPFGLVI